MPVLLGPVMEQFALSRLHPSQPMPTASLKHLPQFKSWVTPAGGLILMPESDERLAFGERSEQHLSHSYPNS
jgi:hypothetical protein